MAIKITATPSEREREREGGSLTMVNIVSAIVIGTGERKRDGDRMDVTRAFN